MHMNQIKKFQTAPGPLTYYGGLPVKDADARTTLFGNNRKSSATFDNGTWGGYNVDRIVYDDGMSVQDESGRQNGVKVDINSIYDPQGNIVQSDTTYNGIRRGDIGYEELQGQFEGAIDRPVSNFRKLSPIYWAAQGVKKLVGKNQQGGYLRLQKQGGKLTEVWTPFN
jgi:hypothetical protein